MKKVIRITESDLKNLVKSVIKEQATEKLINGSSGTPIKSPLDMTSSKQSGMNGSTTQPANSNLKATLEKLVGVGSGDRYQEICKVCNQQTNLNMNNPKAKKAAQEFAQAIKGLESTFSNFGGSGSFADKNSSAFKAGQALERNLDTAEDICTTIKYYNSYGGGEEFCEAVRGELKYKMDAGSNSDELVGIPIFRILMGREIMSVPGNRR